MKLHVKGAFNLDIIQMDNIKNSFPHNGIYCVEVIRNTNSAMEFHCGHIFTQHE